MPRSAGLFDSPDTLALDWKGLYQEHGPRLRRIAERRVGPAQAEDVVQDTFMRAFRNRTSLDPSRPIGAWLSSITLYSSTDALRRRSVRPELAAGDEPEVATNWTVEDEFENAVRRMGIEKAFDSLNHRQRRVLQRLEVDGWTQEEVAAHEQISTEAVKSLAARARRTFREVYSAFAENMGVFGGAVAGPALLRLRARIQRLQGFAVEHVGAFSVAAATVTVVAIATVPTALPRATMADEAPDAELVSQAADTAAFDVTGGAPSLQSTTAPEAPLGATATVSGDSSEVAPNTNSEVRAEATASAGRGGNGASVGVAADTDGPQDDSTTTVVIDVSDCEGVTAGTFCLVVDTADQAAR